MFQDRLTQKLGYETFSPMDRYKWLTVLQIHQEYSLQEIENIWDNDGSTMVLLENYVLNIKCDVL